MNNFLFLFKMCIHFSWSCKEPNSTPRPHPLSQELGLVGEPISLLESSDCRATVVTSSGKMATFYDSVLRGGFSYIVHVCTYVHCTQIIVQYMYNYMYIRTYIHVCL